MRSDKYDKRYMKRAQKAARQRERSEGIPHKRSKKKTVITILVCIAVLMAALAAGAYFYLNHMLSKSDYIDTGSTEWCIDDNVAKELKNYRNILVLGTDSRNMKSYSGGNSDAIIVVSIDKKTDKIKMVSVMRDTFMKIDSATEDELYYTKITEAHGLGGSVWTARALNRNLDLNIDEFVVFNWKAVADMVDAVGGINVRIESYEISDLNRYGAETAKKVGGTYTPIYTAGVHKLDGVQAATYCRIRKTSGGDSYRTLRMKKVMTALFKKSKNMNLSELQDLADNTLPEISTNMKTTAILGLMTNIKNYELGSSSGFPYDYWGGLYYSKWYAIPQTLSSNVKELHKKMFRQKDYQLSDTASEISKEIIEKTGVSAPSN